MCGSRAAGGSQTAPTAALHLVRLPMHDRRGALVPENTYRRYTSRTTCGCCRRCRVPGWMRSAARPADRPPRPSPAFVTNRGQAVAAMVRLAVRDGRGNRVLPATYADDAFWPLPGESCEAVVSWPRRLGQPRGLTVTAEVYNA